MQQENNYIFNSAVYEILLHENQRVSADKEAHANVESDFDENKIYQIENISLVEIEEKLE